MTSSFLIKYIELLQHSRTRKWAAVLLPGLCLFYVLFAFEAFGIPQGTSLSGHSFLQRSLIFGLTTSCVFYLFEFHIMPRKPKLIVWRILEILTGATATYLLFNHFWNWTEWSWSSYSLLLMEYSLVMIIPFAIVYLLKTPSKKKDEIKPWTFSSTNGKDAINIHPQNLLYAKAAGNYVEVYFLLGDKVKSKLLRNTLKNIEEEIPELTRCSRSILVNQQKVSLIETTKGKLELNLGAVQIPVSSNYAESFTQ